MSLILKDECEHWEKNDNKYMVALSIDMMVVV